jgi:hypothetical protein
MENISPEPLKAFSLDGVINDDSVIWQRKNDYIELLGIQMRNLGYVPRLDMKPEFVLEYNRTKQNYTFRLSVFGVHVGERESEWIFGIDEEGPIPIPQSRLNESFLEAE